MSDRRVFTRIGSQLTKLCNPDKYYHDKQQKMCKEKFDFFKLIETSKGISNAGFRDSTRQNLKKLDDKINVYSNKRIEKKIHVFSKKRIQKELMDQQEILRKWDLNFNALENSTLISLSKSNNPKKKDLSELNEIRDYVSCISDSITKHIELIDKQLDLKTIQINPNKEQKILNDIKKEKNKAKVKIVELTAKKAFYDGILQLDATQKQLSGFDKLSTQKKEQKQMKKLFNDITEKSKKQVLKKIFINKH